MRTVFFKNEPKIIGASSVGGPKESFGPLREYIDFKLDNDTFDEKSFEKSEAKMMFTAIKNAILDAKKQESEINAVISGDLLNQIVASTFSARNFNFGYLGAYNACATFTESIILASTLINGNHFNNVVCGTSSHFSSAERQYRYPLELGSTRPPLSQWTVTGAGAVVISNGKEDGIKIKTATVGKIVDYGVKDANNMGAAMAPAACDTLLTHFNETGLSPDHYDLIITGDLGTFGSRILKDLAWEKGLDISKQHVDCGELIYNLDESEYQGGSGAGCSSLVFSAYFYKLFKEKRLKRVLLMSTGALLSSLTTQQGESIPAIAHAVSMEI